MILIMITWIFSVYLSKNKSHLDLIFNNTTIKSKSIAESDKIKSEDIQFNNDYYNSFNKNNLLALFKNINLLDLPINSIQKHKHINSSLDLI